MSFEAHSSQDWPELARAALKGGDPNGLNWSDSSGLERRPIYFERPQGAHPVSEDGRWSIRPRVSLKQAAQAAGQGVQQLALTEPGWDQPHYREGIEAGSQPEDKVLGVDYDPFLWCDLDTALAWTEKGARVALNGALMREAGATPLQEVTWLAAALKEFGRHFEFSQVEIRTAVGSEFFTELSKLRALRGLLSEVTEGFGCPPIHAVNLLLEYTSADPYPNLLRACTSGMAAVLGGADSLTLRPYNPQDPNSLRLSIHQQHLMTHESYLDQVADPAAGSYAVEHFTQSLISEARAQLEIIEGGRRISGVVSAG